MNLTNNITSTSGSRDISMPIAHSILINPMIIQSIFKNIQKVMKKLVYVRT